MKQLILLAIVLSFLSCKKEEYTKVEDKATEMADSLQAVADSLAMTRNLHSIQQGMHLHVAMIAVPSKLRENDPVFYGLVLSVLGISHLDQEGLQQRQRRRDISPRHEPMPRLLHIEQQH